ncbi:MAG: hypothetical protein PHF86_00670 [Candidatus Nanoarchaeia archaeon]|nr:hypothetical protein [Candidatus Nanoarchaeia archaeon]
MTKFKDLVFIIMFLATIAGWIITSVTNKAKMKMAIEQNTQVVKELKGEINKINDYITKQSELNGQIIQFMSNKTSYNLQKFSLDSIYNNIEKNLSLNKEILPNKGNDSIESHIAKNIKNIDNQQKQLESLLKDKNKSKNNKSKKHSTLLAKT